RDPFLVSSSHLAMPPSGYVLCLHCNSYITPRREREHRRLAVQPYPEASTTPPPRPRLRHIFDIDPESAIVEASADEESDEEGDANAHAARSARESSEPASESTADHDLAHLGDPGEAITVDATDAIEPMNDLGLDETWLHRPIDVLYHDDSEDEDGDAGQPSSHSMDGAAVEDIHEDAPSVEALGEGEEDEYFDWEAMESHLSSLSASDRLGESYEALAARARTLDEYDRMLCRAFSYRLKTHTSDRAFTKIPFAFPQEEELPSLDAIRKRVAFLSEFQPQTYDCCVNSCCCY
ncbi:hypothetical protein GGF50DRAFT_93310, partial [Schizophyllum commune]